jgi:hypothetical protein
MLGKRWCFTVNYSNEAIACFHDAADRAYVIIGREVGENGTPHMQGYITFFKPKRLGACKHIHPTAHWEIARGSTEQNISYCSKEGDFHELGDRPKVGPRAIIEAVDMIVAGESITEAPDRIAALDATGFDWRNDDLRNNGCNEMPKPKEKGTSEVPFLHLNK